MTFERAAELAFRGDLAAALRIAGRLPESHEIRWLQGYVDAARGRFARAERTLGRILASRPPADPVTQARAAVTLGSVLRQTDRHAEARRVERAALNRAPSAALRAHLWIGLAADAVGLGELSEVDEALRAVGSRPAGGWRGAVRARWVRCERDLLAGDPVAAAAHARRALAIATRAKARRHLAKSHLFLGVALFDAAALDRGGRRAAPRRSKARGSLRRARTLARAVGAEPIAAVAERLLAERR